MVSRCFTRIVPSPNKMHGMITTTFALRAMNVIFVVALIQSLDYRMYGIQGICDLYQITILFIIYSDRCQIHIGTIEIYVKYLLELLRFMSNMYWINWKLCQICIRSIEVYVKFLLDLLRFMSNMFYIYWGLRQIYNPYLCALKDIFLFFYTKNLSIWWEILNYEPLWKGIEIFFLGQYLLLN